MSNLPGLAQDHTNNYTYTDGTANPPHQVRTLHAGLDNSENGFLHTPPTFRKEWASRWNNHAQRLQRGRGWPIPIWTTAIWETCPKIAHHRSGWEHHSCRRHHSRERWYAAWCSPAIIRQSYHSFVSACFISRRFLETFQTPWLVHEGQEGKFWTIKSRKYADFQVNVRWADRQFILPDHLSRKIAGGATRNLIIVNRTALHTAKSIRDDLEHIHNLVVVNIRFEGKNAYIATNSVHNAMFVRTCIMSRM